MVRPRLRPGHLERLALAGLCLLAFAWRVAWLDSQSLWRDEVDSLRFASRALPDLLANFAKPGENGPLYFLLLRPWLAAAGHSEFALRFPAALAGTLAVPLTFALGRRLLGWDNSRLSPANPALVAALLVAVNPFLAWYSQEGKMYGMLVVLVLGAQVAFLAAITRGGVGRWLLYLAWLAMAVLTHVLATLLVAVHATWLLILGRPFRRRWLGFGLTLLIPALPFFLLSGWWQVRLFLSPDFQTGHAFLPLHSVGLALLTGFGQGVDGQAGFLLLAPLVFFLLVGATMGARAQGPDGPLLSQRAWALLLCWVLLPPLLLFAISLRKPLFLARYVIWIGPALALLLAAGVQVLWRYRRPLGWIGLAFLAAVGLQAGWRQAHTPIKSDFRAAAAYLAAHRQPGDRLLFQIPYVRYTFEYYAGQQAGALDGPYTNSGNPPEQVDRELATALADAPAVWLIASEEGLWDERGLTRAWLASHGQQTDSAQFQRVEVLRYALSPQPLTSP